ncbi:hypothetical protein BRC81_02950 [Halobacteriales archaeon QS_1_68_20]|nr:MAG: hypothetical protein BRC81_02950 [Halobacteriales archaeon QS_1_68_20]
MTVQDHAILTLHADVDGDGSKEAGKFELRRGSQQSPFETESGIEMLQPIGAPGSGSLDTIVNLWSTLSGGEPGRKDLTLDLGAGQHYVEISFAHAPGDVQWGDGSGSLPADATHANHPLTQEACLLWYLLVGTYDSRGGATLEYGEWHEDGAFGPLDVVPMQPSLSWDAGEQQSELSGSIRCRATDTNPGKGAATRGVI